LEKSGESNGQTQNNDDSRGRLHTGTHLGFILAGSLGIKQTGIANCDIVVNTNFPFFIYSIKKGNLVKLKGYGPINYKESQP
jgi:hypothetical protein